MIPSKRDDISAGDLDFHRNGGTGTSWSSPVHLFVEHLGLSFSGAVNFQWESSGGRLLRIAGVVSKNSAVNALSSPSQIRRVGSSRGAKTTIT